MPFQQYARSSEGRVREIAMNTASASHRVPARELVTPEQLARLRDPVEWRSIGIIAHAWAVIFGAMALVAVLPNPLAYSLPSC